MSDTDSNFKTPCSHSRPVLQSTSGSDAIPYNKVTDSMETIIIPPSPAMKLLGFGTGVNVFLMERFSPNRGCYGSPWAVKKINRKIIKSPAADTSCSDITNGSSPKLYRKQTIEEMAKERLEVEAKYLRSLDHPNIIGFRSFTTALDGTKCLVMESGERDLYNMLEELADAEAVALPAQDTLKMCCDISSALQYLHATKRLLHGDIKSANVLIKGNFAQAKLCDFGVCLKLTEQMVSQENSFYTGTECWSPPEVIEDESSPVTDKADIFAFGLTIWECVTLSAPHLDWLSVPDGEEDLSADEQDRLLEAREENYARHLGTRPALTQRATELSGLYLQLIETFYHCTTTEPEERPSAAKLCKCFASLAESTHKKRDSDEDSIVLHRSDDGVAKKRKVDAEKSPSLL